MVLLGDDGLEAGDVLLAGSADDDSAGRAGELIVDLVEAHDRAATIDDLEDDVGRADVATHRGRIEGSLQLVESREFQVERMPAVIMGFFGSDLLQVGVRAGE
jgi:hypothetical protein